MLDPPIIAQVFIHTSPTSLIEPLRDFLDTWVIDEDDDNGTIPPFPNSSIHSSQIPLTSNPFRLYISLPIFPYRIYILSDFVPQFPFICVKLIFRRTSINLRTIQLNPILHMLLRTPVWTRNMFGQSKWTGLRKDLVKGIFKGKVVGYVE